MLELNIIIFISLLFLICLTNNAIHALLSLILLFINFAIVLFYLDVLFLAFSYILVYIGAICVLFLYIILLLHVRIFHVIYKTQFFMLIGLILGTFFIILSSHIDISVSFTDFFHLFLTDIVLLSLSLFVNNVIYLIFGMVLLLIALLLSIFLSINFSQALDMPIDNNVMNN